MRIALVCSLALLLAGSAAAQGVPIKGGATSDLVGVSTDNKAARVTSYPRGNGANVTGHTGIVGAALAAGGAVFCARLDPGYSGKAYITSLNIQYTTQVVYTVPLSATRRLGLYRGSGAACSGGTSTPAITDESTETSEFNIAQGGDLRTATTAALTVTGITFDTDPIATCSLGHVGAAGAFYACELIGKDDAGESPIVLLPGQVIAIRAVAVFDAAGTWTMSTNMSWVEE